MTDLSELTKTTYWEVERSNTTVKNTSVLFLNSDAKYIGNTHTYISKDLALNSRWRSPINSIWHNDITCRSWLVLCVSAANELAAQHSNTWLALAVAVCSALQKPFTFPSSTCIDSAIIHVCYMGVISCVLYVEQQYFLHVHSSMLWMLADLFCKHQTH